MGALAFAPIGGAYVAWRLMAQPVHPRVVVAPFLNATGDSANAQLGTLLASWTQDALVRSAMLDVVDFRSLTTDRGDVKAVPIGSGPGGVRAFADAAGATRVLTGSVHALRDSLEFRAEIVDPATGTVLAAISPVHIAKSDPMPGLDVVAQRAAGALATTLDSQFKTAFQGTPHLPTLAAYKEFVAGFESYTRSDYGDALRHFDLAVAADPAFLTAQVYQTQLWATVTRKGPRDYMYRDSVTRRWKELAKRSAELSPNDAAWVDFYLAGAEGARDRQIEAAQRGHALWPDRWNVVLMNALLQSGRVREALALEKSIDPTKGLMRFEGAYVSSLVAVHLMAGDPKGALKAAEQAHGRSPRGAYATCWHAIALAVLGRFTEADSLLDLVHGRNSVAFERTCRRDFFDYVAAFGPRENASGVMREALRFSLSPEGTWPDRLYQLTLIWSAATSVGDSVRALAYADSMVLAEPNSQWARLRLARARAVFGDRAGAMAAEREALALPQQADQYKGGVERFRALIALALGDRENAVQFLRQAKALGYPMTALYIGEAWNPLRGYPPFEALIDR